MLLFRILKSILVFSVTLFVILTTHAPATAKIDCLSCHDRKDFTNKVTHEPVAIGTCLSCHNPHVSRYANLLQEQVKDLCYSCHTEAAAEQLQGVVHNPVLQGECLGCHNPHASSQTALLKDRLSTTCLSCHTSLPKEFKYTHAPYAKGKCDSCHQPHQSSYAYLLKKDPDALCQGCHQLAVLRQKHTNFPAELGKCGSCHNPHGSDRPKLVRNILHEPYSEGCQDCHKGKGIPVKIDTCLECHPGISEKMASSHNHLVRYGDNGCTACHSPHAGDDKRLLKGKERHVCGQCHESTFKRYDATKFKHQFTDACNNCHAPHGSNHPAMFKGPINTVCDACHGLHGAFTHPIGEKVFDPRTGQMMTCASCHASKGSDYPYHTRGSGKKEMCIKCHSI